MLDQILLEVELVGDELNGGVVDVVSVVVVEEEEQQPEDVIATLEWFLYHLVYQQLLQVLLLRLLGPKCLLVLDYLPQKQLQAVLDEESVEQGNQLQH